MNTVASQTFIVNSVNAVPDAPTVTPEPVRSPGIYDTLDAFIDVMDLSGTVEFKSANICASYASCGISILSGVTRSLPKDIVYKVLHERSRHDKKTIREAFVMFSDTDHDGNRGGNALAAYIRENQLGDIVEAGPRMNPNSGNQIKMWIWSPPHKSLHPHDRYMPVYGKKLVRDKYGNLTHYEDDPRFVSNLNEL